MPPAGEAGGESDLARPPCRRRGRAWPTASTRATWRWWTPRATRSPRPRATPTWTRPSWREWGAWCRRADRRAGSIPRTPASWRPASGLGSRPRHRCARAGQAVMPFGTPGGDVQQQAMLQVFLNVTVFGMPPQKAVEAPRLASRSFPDSFWPHPMAPGKVEIERRMPAATRAGLAERGHEVSEWPEWEWRAGAVCGVQGPCGRHALDRRRSAPRRARHRSLTGSPASPGGALAPDPGHPQLGSVTHAVCALPHRRCPPGRRAPARRPADAARRRRRPRPR